LALEAALPWAERGPFDFCEFWRLAAICLEVLMHQG
jgi:hypothetical protein